MPSYSMEFWVAMTRKGEGSGWVTPSTVTWRSAMASRRADWVLGVARLISSARTSWGGDGAGAEAEFAGGLVIDGDAGDIAGQQVGGELDTGEGAADGEGDGTGEHSFADTGDILYQNMAGGDEGGEGLFDDLVFADDDGGDVVGDAAGDGGGVKDGGGDAGGGGKRGVGVQHGDAPARRGLTLGRLDWVGGRQFSIPAGRRWGQLRLRELQRGRGGKGESGGGAFGVVEAQTRRLLRRKAESGWIALPFNLTGLGIGSSLRGTPEAIGNARMPACAGMTGKYQAVQLETLPSGWGDGCRLVPG